MTGEAGIPDRLVILPGGKCIFVELKREGEKPRPIQDYRIQQLKFLGCDVLVVDSKEDIRDLLWGGEENANISQKETQEKAH